VDTAQPPFLEGKISLLKSDKRYSRFSYWRNIFGEFIERARIVDVNQGLDARLINDEVANKYE